MWSAPVERRSPDGSKYSLVLLDTEGIDAYDQVGGCCLQGALRAGGDALFPFPPRFVVCAC